MRRILQESAIKRALLVSMNYPNTPKELPGGSNDVEMMKGCLSDYCGYERRYIKTVSDELHDILSSSSSYSKSKRRRNKRRKLVNARVIINHLCAMIRASKKGDTMLFMFSGHGVFDEYDGEIFPGLYTGKGSVLGSIIQDVPIGINVITIIDCCGSGAILESMMERKQYPYISDGPSYSTSFTSVHSFQDSFVHFYPDLSYYLSDFVYCFIKQVQTESDNMTHIELIKGIDTMLNQSAELFLLMFPMENKDSIKQIPGLFCSDVRRDEMVCQKTLQHTAKREGKEPKPFKDIAKDQKVDSAMKELSHGKNERKGKSQVAKKQEIEASTKRELKNKKIRSSVIKIEMDPASRAAFIKELYKIVAMHRKKALEERY